MPVMIGLGRIPQSRWRYSPEVTTQAQANAPYVTHLPVLKKGKAGEAVRFLQQFLICYMGYNLLFDGQFGSQTEGAVRDFQSYYNHLDKSNPNYLIVDGIVGKETYRAIGNMFC